jgi:hypothetical protein
MLNGRVLMILLAVAAFASVAVFVHSADAMDPAMPGFQAEEEQNLSVQPFDEGMGPRPMNDGPQGQSDRSVPPGSDKGRPVPIEFLDPNGNHDMAKLANQTPRMMPDDRAPRDLPAYAHDADPEDIEANLEPMMDGDIAMFDPGFVQDAIDYAEKQGMQDVVDILKAKLAEIIENYMRSSSTLNSADSRASGLDVEADEDDDFAVVEEEEEPAEEFVFFEGPTPVFFESFSAPAAQNLLLLSL